MRFLRDRLDQVAYVSREHYWLENLRIYRGKDCHLQKQNPSRSSVLILVALVPTPNHFISDSVRSSPELIFFGDPYDKHLF